MRSKEELVAALRAAVAEATDFCARLGVRIDEIHEAGLLERLERISAAVNALISPDAIRSEFFGHERWVNRLYQAVKPDPAVLEFAATVFCLGVIADTIRLRIGEGSVPDIRGILADVNSLLDESIAADGFVIGERTDRPALDLSRIDFNALAKRFRESKSRNIELEQLKAAVQAQLDKLIRLNPTRIDFVAKFEELIESYNSGSRNIEELFEQLVRLTQCMTEEQSRHIRENLSPEELVILDILTRPAPELTAEERGEIKKVARELYARLRQLLVLDWRRKASARSQVRMAIEEVLDAGLPRAFDKPLYEQKCTALFEHVFERNEKQTP